jgi:hypothetical protein
MVHRMLQLTTTRKKRAVTEDEGTKDFRGEKNSVKDPHFLRQYPPAAHEDGSDGDDDGDDQIQDTCM